MTAREPTIHELIEQSSLGSDAARSLRSRTTDEQLDLVHRNRAELDRELVWARARADRMLTEAQANAARLMAEVKARARMEAAAMARFGRPRDGTGTVTLGAGSDDSMSDQELLRRHAAGDPDAFGIVLERHRDRLMAVPVDAVGRSRSAHGRSMPSLQQIDAGEREVLVLLDIEGRSIDEAAVILGCSRRTVRRRQARGRAQLEPLLRDDVRTSQDGGRTN